MKALHKFSVWSSQENYWQLQRWDINNYLSVFLDTFLLSVFDTFGFLFFAVSFRNVTQWISICLCNCLSMPFHSSFFGSKRKDVGHAHALHGYMIHHFRPSFLHFHNAFTYWGLTEKLHMMRISISFSWGTLSRSDVCDHLFDTIRTAVRDKCRQSVSSPTLGPRSTSIDVDCSGIDPAISRQFQASVYRPSSWGACKCISVARYMLLWLLVLDYLQLSFHLFWEESLALCNPRWCMNYEL